MTVIGASSVAITYGYESAFKGGTSNMHLFGKEAKNSGVDFKNSQQPLGQLYTREITDFVYGRNIGDTTMDFVLANPWFFTGAFGDPTQTVSAGEYTYIWSTDPTFNSGSNRIVKTMHLEISENRGTPEVRNAKGAICTSLSLKSSIDQTVSVSNAIQWGHEDAIGTVFPVSLPTDEAFTPYNFVNATVELPSGQVLAVVQDWELNIDTGNELLWGAGSADAADVVGKQIVITGKINKAKQASTLLQDVQARVPIANLRIFITNGLSTTSEKSIEILLTNVGLSGHTTTGQQPADLILENIDFQAARCQITAKNNQNVATPMT